MMGTVWVLSLFKHIYLLCLLPLPLPLLHAPFLTREMTNKDFTGYSSEAPAALV